MGKEGERVEGEGIIFARKITQALSNFRILEALERSKTP